MVITLCLLIAVPCQHRLVERGNATTRLFKVANRFAEVALAPFALAIGCDLYVVTAPYWGERLAVFGGGIAICLALVLWYGLGIGLRKVVPNNEQEKPLPSDRTTDLHEKIDQMLTESRVILPGAQALLGFQFAVTMTKGFAALPPLDRQIHFVALGAIAIAMMLLLAPATVHRLTFAGRDVPRFHEIGSVLVTAALAPLAVGIAADVYVATVKMLDDHLLAACAGSAAALLLAVFWYGLPLYLRYSKVRNA
jgi:hypothetical protein